MGKRIVHGSKFAIIMVGLPARGKTSTAKKLVRYLSWLGVSVCMVSVADYRRETFGAMQSHNFFDPGNVEVTRKREETANKALTDLCDQMVVGGFDVGIYDASNTGEEKRAAIASQLNSIGIMSLFIEMVSTDEKLIMSTIEEELATSPDYRSIDAKEAIADFYNRIRHFEKTYKQLSDPSQSYIRLLNSNEQIIVNNVRGYVQSRIIYFLMNHNIKNRTFFFCPDNYYVDDLTYMKGSSEPLNAKGLVFRSKLQEFFNSRRAVNDLRVWTSTNLRSQQLAENLPRVKEWTALGDKNPGILENLTDVELKTKFAKELVALESQPFNYRLPRAESLHDVANRLEPIIIEMEREDDDIVIIGHEILLCFLLAYFRGMLPQDVLDLSISEHTILQLTPKAYTCEVKTVEL